MTRAPETLINEAMTLENAEFLGAPPHERTEDWRGYANGLKPRRMLTRSGRRRSPCAGARRGAGIPPVACPHSLVHPNRQSKRRGFFELQRAGGRRSRPEAR